MNVVFRTILFFLTTTSTLVAQSKPLKVLASASMIKDMTEAISGGIVEVDMIVPIGGDPHLYEPTPKDAREVASADLILLNGLTFEGWITELINNSGTKAQSVIVTKDIDVLRSQTYKNSVDPHAWMTAANGIIYSTNIKNALITLDPANKERYEENFEKYRRQLEELEFFIHEEIQKIPERQRILITSHDAFQYYGKQYGIRLEAIMGISTEAEAQTSDVIRVNKVISEFDVPAIFIESTINPKLMEQLAIDNKISIGGKLYADSLGDDKSPANTYINMLKYNTVTIVNALSNPSGSKQVPDKNNNLTYLMILGVVLVSGLLLLIYKFNR